MRRQAPDAVGALKRWVADLETRPTGSCEVPDFEALGVDFDRLEGENDGDMAAQAHALRTMSGRVGYARRDGRAACLISYVPELPPSLMPMLVTDASAARGVNHASYDQMARSRPIIRLKEATKTYRNLTILTVPVAASRSAYSKPNSFQGRDLIDMLTAYIRRVAPEPVLVVAYKNRMMMHGVAERTIEEAVRARLDPEENGRVKVLTFGRHTATNEHKAVRRVIFAGLNFLPKTAAYAASGAALERPMNTAEPGDHPGEEDVREMGRGLLRDSTLQAILRGAARMGVDGDCGGMEAIIPQAPQTGLTPEEFGAMFPGATIQTDRTLLPGKPLKGNVKLLVDAIQRRQEAGETEISGPDLYAALGFGRGAFQRLKVKPEFRAWLVQAGWREVDLKGRVSGFRRWSV